MTATADTHHAAQPAAGLDGPAGTNRVRLVGIEHQDANGPDQCRTTSRTETADQGRGLAEAGHGRTIRSWPLLVLALPAAVAVWSGWVGIGRADRVRGESTPLPGIWDSLHLDTAVTLPVGVEAYAAYALRAWLSASPAISAQTRRFARWSAIGSLVLGMALTTSSRRPGGHPRPVGSITTAVSCLPVLVLGMGAALTHLLSADAHGVKTHDQAGSPASDQVLMRADQCATCQGQGANTPRPDRLTEAQIVADRLRAAGQRVSRRTLRAAGGGHGSNAELGALARIITSRLTTTRTQTDPA